MSDGLISDVIYNLYRSSHRHNRFFLSIDKNENIELERRTIVRPPDNKHFYLFSTINVNLKEDRKNPKKIKLNAYDLNNFAFMEM